MPDQIVIHTRADIDQSVAQARKWAGHPDNGWAPTREQVTVLADQVERLQSEVETMTTAVHRATDRIAGARTILSNWLTDGHNVESVIERATAALDGAKR